MWTSGREMFLAFGKTAPKELKPSTCPIHDFMKSLPEVPADQAQDFLHVEAIRLSAESNLYPLDVLKKMRECLSAAHESQILIDPRQRIIVIKALNTLTALYTPARLQNLSLEAA